jgi:hypothetical protein
MHASWGLETELEEAVAHAAAQIGVCNIGRKNCRLPCFSNPGHRANNVTFLLIEICVASDDPDVIGTAIEAVVHNITAEVARKMTGIETSVDTRFWVLKNKGDNDAK